MISARHDSLNEDVYAPPEKVNQLRNRATSLESIPDFMDEPSPRRLIDDTQERFLDPYERRGRIFSTYSPVGGKAESKDLVEQLAQ